MKDKETGTQRVKHTKRKRELREMSVALLPTHWWGDLPQVVRSVFGLCIVAALVVGVITYAIYTVADPVVGTQLAILSNLIIVFVSFGSLVVIAYYMAKMSAEINQLTQTNSILTKWTRDLCKEFRAIGKNPKAIIPEADDDLIFFDLDGDGEDKFQSRVRGMEVRVEDYMEDTKTTGTEEVVAEKAPEATEEITTIGNTTETTEVVAASDNAENIAATADAEATTNETADGTKQYIPNHRDGNVTAMLTKDQQKAETQKLPDSAAVREAMNVALGIELAAEPEPETEVEPEATSEEISEVVAEADSQPATEEYDLYKDAAEHNIDPDILEKYIRAHGCNGFAKLPKKIQRAVMNEMARRAMNGGAYRAG